MLKTLITLLILFSHYNTQFEENKEEVARPIYIVKAMSVADEPIEKAIYETYIVTAYTAGYESTGKTPNHPEYGITASGETVKENRTAACPPSMEFGTRLYIPYFNNTFVCEDRGGAIDEGDIDIYMENLDEALEFGRRKLEVKVMEEGN